MARLRQARLAKVKAELARRDVAGALLYDPINIRYATGSRNMAVWTLHNAVRYAFVATEGPVVIFDFHGCGHLSDGLDTVDDTRAAVSWYYFGAGPHMQARARKWAAEIADLVDLHGGGNRRLAVDTVDPAGLDALRALNIEVVDGQGACEAARLFKTPDEIAAMQQSIAVAEAGMYRMREALRPGVTEQAIWALLHETNIALGGEWIETRLLTSGEKTNPWFQEAGTRLLRPGDLLSFDTDLIGPYGYCADISRTYHCGPGRPSDEQRKLYRLAWEQIQHNTALIRPGLGYRELAERAMVLPEDYMPQRYSVLAHGVGLCDEYPACVYLQDFDDAGYDGVFEAGQTVCVESYVGAVGGREGVKLEQQVLVTDTGVALLSTFPWEEDLLGREI
ncbi:MAG: aminopeptidase P family protein [Rhodospirillaceae bacterium]|nr:aminopeptidase P family protein [Rhodospirillaceae bacterium]